MVVVIYIMLVLVDRWIVVSVMLFSMGCFWDDVCVDCCVLLLVGRIIVVSISRLMVRLVVMFDIMWVMGSFYWVIVFGLVISVVVVVLVRVRLSIMVIRVVLFNFVVVGSSCVVGVVSCVGY